MNHRINWKHIFIHTPHSEAIGIVRFLRAIPNRFQRNDGPKAMGNHSRPNLIGAGRSSPEPESFCLGAQLSLSVAVLAAEARGGAL